MPSRALVPSTRPSATTGILLDQRERTPLGHRGGAGDPALQVEAHRRGGHEAERRQRRVPPADGRHARENRAEAVAPGGGFQLRARVGDGHEVPGGLDRADSGNHAVEEIRAEDIGLERRPRLAGYDDQRRGERDPAVDCRDLRGIRRVEDVQARRAGLRTEGLGQDLGTQARPAHAEQQDVGEAVRVRTCRAKASSAGMAAAASAGALSQPSQRCSSAPVQSELSPAQRRLVLSPAVQAAAAASTSPRSGCGNCSNTLMRARTARCASTRGLQGP